MSQTTEFDLSIIGTVGLPAGYGGFETLAEELSARLATRYSVCVYCTRKGRRDFPGSYLGATLRYVGFDANGAQSIPYDIVSMWKAAFSSKVLLVLGVSGCLFLPLLRLLAPKLRIVTNIDGLEWKREKWGRAARLVLRASEAFAVRFSDVVIADNRGIQDHVSATYTRLSRLIPYGGDNRGHNAPASGPRDTPFGPGGYYFAVCRIEPENNVHHILEAFRQTTQYKLVMVGNWRVSDYANRLRAAHADLANIQLLDPIYDQSRLRRLRTEASAYIHGHSAGGTNPSLVEAMTAGVAVLAFDVHYNRHTTEGNALYWRDAAGLAEILARMTVPMLQNNAQMMRRIAAERYTWETVTRDYEAVLFPTKEDS